jgi:phosphoribosylanthranilate isomerase
VKVKICGITKLDDALLCSESGADAIGFIFYNKSKRYIQPEEAKSIISELPAFILKVGVFVNENSDTVNKTAKLTGLNAVQLHSDEDMQYLERINYPIIKSFRVHEGFNYETLNSFINCDWLLDTYSEKEYGGTGEVFDWDLIPENIRNKIILAGGISINNIEEVFRKVKPFMVDLSSSLESSPGRKDKNKVTEFMNKIKELRNH